MGRDTDKDWVKIAEENPYWGVLSAERFMGKGIAGEEREQFFASGEATVEHIFSVIRRHFAANFAPARSLEFGCGVGRMLIPIARRSGEAIGVDVAPNMLELALRHLREADVRNARVMPADELFNRQAERESLFDFINSFIVLQHVPPERGYRIIIDLLRLLRPGGVATLGICFARGEKLSWSGPAATYIRGDGAKLIREGSYNLGAPEGTILMFDYDLNQIMVLAGEAGMAPIIAYPLGDPETHLSVWLYMQKAH